MGFLYPQFLFGLLALSIPLIIHLFNFRRTQKVYFSNSQFLQQVKDSKSARQKLKHLLIMASRMLFLFFLVLAFAQPFIPKDESVEQQDLVYIYLDNSLSMSNQVTSDLSAFDQAIQNAEDIVRLYPKETKFKLLTNDFSSPFRVFRSGEEILDMLTEVDQTGVQREFPEIWNRLNSQPSSAKSDWYLISDFQKSTFSSLQTFDQDSLQNYFFIPLSFNSTSNLFVDSVFLKNPFLIANDQNSIAIRMRNTGSEPVRDLVLSLAINDRQVANAGIDIPPGGVGMTEINLNFPLEGTNPARISFEEFPVSFDNDFYFNLNLTQRAVIIEIKNTSNITSVAKVYGNNKLFNFQSYHINNLDYTAVDQADLVILNALEQPLNSLIDRLLAFRESGGHILIIPGPSADISGLQRIANFAPLRVSQDTSYVPLEAPEEQNPFFQNIFEDQRSQSISMPTVRNTIIWDTQRGDNYLIAKNGIPYLSSDYGRQVYLFGSPLTDKYTSLTQHAVFVPIMYKVAALSKAFDRKLYHTTDEQVIVIKLDSANGNELYSMSNGEEEIVPDQRILGQELFLEVPSEIVKPGFYSLSSPQGVVELIPYNNTQQESFMDQFSATELEELLGGENVSVLGESEFQQYTDRILKAKSGIPLWKYAVILALLSLLAEVLLIRFLK